MSEHTPTKYEVLEAWVAHTSHDLPTAYDLVEAGESFNRWLAAEKAKWQAEALREAASGIRGWEDAQWLRARLRARAYHIEKGSDDDR